MLYTMYACGVLANSSVTAYTHTRGMLHEVLDDLFFFLLFNRILNPFRLAIYRFMKRSAGVLAAWSAMDVGAIHRGCRKLRTEREPAFPEWIYPTRPPPRQPTCLSSHPRGPPPLLSSCSSSPATRSTPQTAPALVVGFQTSILLSSYFLHHLSLQTYKPLISQTSVLVNMGGGVEGSTKSSYPVLAQRPVGQWISKLYKDRLHQFTSTGQYESQNLLALVWPLLPAYPPSFLAVRHVKLTAGCCPG